MMCAGVAAAAAAVTITAIGASASGVCVCGREERVRGGRRHTQCDASELDDTDFRGAASICKYCVCVGCCRPQSQSQFNVFLACGVEAPICIYQVGLGSPRRVVEKQRQGGKARLPM